MSKNKLFRSKGSWVPNRKTYMQRQRHALHVEADSLPQIGKFLTGPASTWSLIPPLVLLIHRVGTFSRSCRPWLSCCNGTHLLLLQNHLILHLLHHAQGPKAVLSFFAFGFANGRKVTAEPPHPPQKQEMVLIPSSTGLSRLEEAPMAKTEHKSIRTFLLLFSSQSLLTG